MVEAEETVLSAPPAHPKQVHWLFSTFIKPRQAMTEIAADERQVWLLPLLLLTVLVIASALVAGPLRQQAAQNAPAELPENFQYMSPEQQEQYLQAQQSRNGPTTTVLFPAIGALVGLWVSWLLLGSILHLVLTLLGSRSTSRAAYNLAAWANLPYAIRALVQIVAMLATRQLINSPGLSGFVAVDTGQAALFARVLLSMVDLYLIWQVVLLLLGTFSNSGLSRKKALSGVLITVLLLLVVSALPGYVAAQFTALDVTRPFIFF